MKIQSEVGELSHVAQRNNQCGATLLRNNLILRMSHPSETPVYVQYA